jgi:hypothetical protein
VFVSELIAITGIRDHHRLEHLIAIPGIRMDHQPMLAIVLVDELVGLGHDVTLFASGSHRETSE